MDFTVKFIAVITAAFLVSGISVVAMIWGWGIEPKNWFVIIPTYAALTIPTAISGVLK